MKFKVGDIFILKNGTSKYTLESIEDENLTYPFGLREEGWDHIRRYSPNELQQYFVKTEDPNDLLKEIL